MTTFIGHLARLLGGPVDNGYEPYVPRLHESASSRPEYKIHYRNPETGIELTAQVNSSDVWSQRKKLTDAGYQVAVTRRQVTTSAWEIVEEAA